VLFIYFICCIIIFFSLPFRFISLFFFIKFNKESGESPKVELPNVETLDEDSELEDPEEDPSENPEDSEEECEEPDKDLNKKEDWGEILGRKGKNIFVHQLANSQINSNKPTTLKVLNEVLAYSNILVSEDVFNSLLAIPKFTFTNLHKPETLDLIYEKLGTPHSKVQPNGIYIFTYLDTSQKYVGSSSQLSFRLKGYLKQTHRSSGKLIPLIKEVGLSKFKLEVICLPYYPDFRSEIVLEQYYLLDPSFNLNTIRVSNNPSGSTSKPLFMYNRDKSILYYNTTQQKDFISKLNISHFTFTKHLTKGTYYLGKYLFTREAYNTAKQTHMTLPEIALMLKNDRVKFNKVKPVNSLSRAILLINVQSNEELSFESLGQCINYLKNKGFSASQTTLAKRLDTNQSYKGFICKTAKNK
jgi:hypothetical protein